MRVYVEDMEPKKITHDKLIRLEGYFSIKKDILEIFSESGMFLVENENVFKLLPKNEKIKKYIDSGVTFIIDETKIEKQICSQIPFEHVSVATTIFVYNSKNIRLIIEGHYKKELSIAVNIDKSDKYSNYVVTNFYFEPKNENLEIENNIFLKNEINVFLSLLN